MEELGPRSVGRLVLVALLLVVTEPLSAQQAERDRVLLEPRTVIPQSFLLPVAPLGGDPMGIPAIGLDQREIVSALLDHRFQGLEEQFRDLEDAARTDPRLEFHLQAGYDAFNRLDETTGVALDDWIDQRPTSAAAYLARARYRLELAHHARGAKNGSETSERQFERMNEYAELAWKDLEASKDLDDQSPILWSMAFAVQRLWGWSEAQAEMLDVALTKLPTSLLVRTSAMYSATPRWGGSYALMREIADSAQVYVGQNPLLDVLSGYPDAERSVVARQGKSYDQALHLMGRAIEHGLFHSFAVERARVYFYANDYVRALADLRLVASARPQDRQVLELKGITQYRVAMLAPRSLRTTLLELSLTDFALLEELRPGDSEIEQWTNRVIERLDQCQGEEPACYQTSVPGQPLAGVPIDRAFVPAAVETVRDLFIMFQRFGLTPAGAGVYLFMALGLFRWWRNGFWIPPYIHFIAGLSLFTIVGINLYWMSVGGSMWTRRYVVILLFPLIPYLIYAMAGGVRRPERSPTDRAQSSTRAL